MIKVSAFKLFGVVENCLNDFIEKEGLNCSVTKNVNDYLVKFDFSTVNDCEIDLTLKKFIATFKKHIYAESDISLEEQLVKILSIRNAKISVAESFTGGGLSSLITSVSGASKVFNEGIVAYSPSAKADRLNVSNTTLEVYKPVSSQVATEMVKGLLSQGNADFCISTTGIAGPLSDDSDFPVGLCFIGVGSNSKVTVYKHKFSGDRSEVTKAGISTALFHAVMALRSGEFDV